MNFYGASDFRNMGMIQHYRAMSKAPDLSIDLPVQDYRPTRDILIPFDTRLCNDAKFNSVIDAMKFVGQHCAYHHHQFTKRLARSYLSLCSVYDPCFGQYVLMDRISKKDFDSPFHEVEKNLISTKQISQA